MSILAFVVDQILRPRHMWGRLIVLLVPFAVLGVVLKLLRINAFFPAADPAEVLAKSASDVAFGIAWGLLWVVACGHGPRWWRTTGFYAAHVTTLILAVFTVLNHEYVVRTGAPLGWEQIAYAWAGQGELAGLLESQISDSTIALLVWAVVSTSLLPTLVGPLLAGVRAKRGGRWIKRAALVGLVGFLAASGWTAPTASAAFSLAAPVRMVVDPVRKASAYPAPSDTLVAGTATGLRATDEEHRNLVVIVLESQRDSSTLPETRQPVTPVLDELATRSIRPERGYTVLPHTSKAITAVHCGITPPADMVNSEADPNGMPAKCLPELLSEQGYATGYFQSATENFERRRNTVDNLGFDYFLPVDKMDTTGFRTANYFGYEDDIMLGPQREWLEANRDQPFLLSMLTVTAHHDYNLQGYEPIDFVDDDLMNKYLQGMHYQDRFVGNVISMFKELGLYEDTVFVITGDHGEGFGEHQLYQHDNTIYEEGMRIPLMVHDPQRDGDLIEGPANQLAVLPTAVDALGFELEGDAVYRPSLLGDEPQGPVYATCHVWARCIAAMEGDLKLIHHFGDRRDEVFNLEADNYEQDDIVVHTDSQWVAEQRAAALQWYADWEAYYKNERE